MEVWRGRRLRGQLWRTQLQWVLLSPLRPSVVFEVSVRALTRARTVKTSVFWYHPSVFKVGLLRASARFLWIVRMKRECWWQRIVMLSFYQTAGRFCKRLDTSADDEVLREVVLSAARETGCPQCVRKREWRSLSPLALENLNMSENMPVNKDNVASQRRNTDWG